MSDFVGMARLVLDMQTSGSQKHGAPRVDLCVSLCGDILKRSTRFTNREIGSRTATGFDTLCSTSRADRERTCIGPARNTERNGAHRSPPFALTSARHYSKSFVIDLFNIHKPRKEILPSHYRDGETEAK